MIYTPPSQPIHAQTVSSELQILKSDLKALSDMDVSQYFKELKLRAYLEKIIVKNERRGVSTGVSVVDLQTKRKIVSHNLDTEHFAASVNKVPIAALVLNDLRSGVLQLDQQLSWTTADRRAGAGVYDQEGAPLQATIRDLLFDMLNPSGNTAVRALVNSGLGGAPHVNERFKQELGLEHTYLQPLDGNRFYVGNTTAREAMQNMKKLLDGNDEYQQLVKRALATNIYTDFGVRSELAGNDFIVLANKVGILDDPEGNNRHDAGIIYNQRTGQAVGFSLINTAPGNPEDVPTAQAGVSLADMGAGLLRFAGDRPQSSLSDEQSRIQDVPAAVPAPYGGRLLY